MEFSGGSTLQNRERFRVKYLINGVLISHLSEFNGKFTMAIGLTFYLRKHLSNPAVGNPYLLRG